MKESGGGTPYTVNIYLDKDDVDSEGSGFVNASDRSATWNDRNQSRYLDSDCNLDGYTNAADRDAAWNNRNLGATLPE